jgi:hypothetical protein
MQNVLAGHATASRGRGRVGHGVLALALLAAIGALLASGSGGWWQLAAFGLGPDLALLLGIAPGLARGQLHPRAVPLYNALHRVWGPAALAAVAVVAGLSHAWLVGALAWALHVAVDRTVGYGLRTRDGFQRS